MPGITVLAGTTVVIPLDDVDTDRIIPARFLSRIARSGYGELLFADSRGPEFPIDAPEAKGASVLVTGTNFGCGSSREHAVWAIQQAGYKAVVAKTTDAAPGFSDIFRQNAANCGLLLVELKARDHEPLTALGSGAQVAIDLPAQTVTYAGHRANFEINAATKGTLLEGLDLIGTTLRYEDDIARYESKLPEYVNPGAGR
ncbi:3-isopropylmalate dehydratase small subunit [bacterium]|nr:MAG: 3-isopropylmalate dehydratase small subunit [bacterium]